MKKQIVIISLLFLGLYQGIKAADSAESAQEYVMLIPTDRDIPELQLDINLNQTVKELKKAFDHSDLAHYFKDGYHLQLWGKEIGNDKDRLTLRDLGIKSGTTISVIKPEEYVMLIPNERAIPELQLNINLNRTIEELRELFEHSDLAHYFKDGYHLKLGNKEIGEDQDHLTLRDLGIKTGAIISVVKPKSAQVEAEDLEYYVK